MRNKITIIMAVVMVWTIVSFEATAAKYDFFGGFIPQGTPVIDGELKSGEWDAMGNLTLYKFFGEDSKIEIYLMWDTNNLYLGAEIEDFELWVDNYDAAQPWVSTWDDDALKWEIDPDYSRDKTLQATDRSFAINAYGSAMRFDKGDGAGGTLGFAVFDTIQKAVKYNGILNDYTFDKLRSASQKDGGFTLEVAVSWHNIFGSATATAPADGFSIGMNFTNIEDDTGGPMDPEYNKSWKRVFDEITRFMGEEGIPENWAEFVISSKTDQSAPNAVSNLKASSTRAFSTQLTFHATGDNGAGGYAQSYDIRYGNSPLTTTNWNSAKVYKNSFKPRKAGQQESFKIIGLQPQKNYYIGIKAVDERGNASSIATVSITTTGDSGDKGYLSVDPGCRYLAWENGETFIPIGDNQGMSWPHIRTFYDGDMWSDDLGRYENFQEWDTNGIQDGRNYIKKLSEHGVNTIRIMAEDMEPSHPVYLAKDMSDGPSAIKFNNDTLNFLTTLLDECAKYDINVIIVPFDTYFYRKNWSKVPFSTDMGGPMSKPSDFYEIANIEYIKKIFKKLVDTIGSHKNLLAWDIVNEFDSDEPGIGWTRATFDKREAVINALGEYMRSIDPNHLVFLSSVRWDPKFTASLTTEDDTPVMGNDPALMLNNNRFDFNSTHTYYHDIRDPNLNDPNNRTAPDGSFTYRSEVTDQDNTIAPAARLKQGLQFYYANTLTPKPYFNTEAGPIEFYTKEYDQYFTKEDDYQIFHNMIWSYLAGGDVGSGLRWAGEMVENHALPDQMRQYQLAMQNFLADNLNFFGYNPQPIGQYLSINTSIPIIKTGISDGEQGIIFLVKDTRKTAYGNVSSTQLSIPKLTPYAKLTFEFWDTYDHTKTSPTSSLNVTADAAGQVKVSLPGFAKTQAIKFYTTGIEAPSTGYKVTDDLWIRAVIQSVSETDNISIVPIEGRWVLGGEVQNSLKIIWGYFYADPSDVSWGDSQNPELFVKIAILNDWVNVNYFHVTRPDIMVYTDYPYDGNVDAADTATGPESSQPSYRFIEHTFENNVLTNKRRLFEDGNPPAGDYVTGSPTGTMIDNGLLRIGSIIKPTGMSFNGRWKLGGTVETPLKIIWGYFYADPSDVSWGDSQNPELFVKIANQGSWINVNYFHVSGATIETYSSKTPSGSYQNGGTAGLDNRFIEFTYE